MADLSGLFRAYDVRGDSGTLMTPQSAYSIARAFACVLRDRNGKPSSTIILGRDSRPSSPALHQAVIGALLKEGVNIVDIGECSSPMLAIAVGSWKADGGIMVTASHNKVSDNGLKLCGERAVSFSRGAGLDEVQGIAERGIFPRDERHGSIEVRDARQCYVDALKHVGTMPEGRVVCDTGWGASALTLPLLGDSIKTLHSKSDLSLATHSSTALNVGELHDLSDAVRDEKVEWGFAFDSDEDRVGVIHKTLGPLSPDDVAFILARWSMRRNSGGTVTGDLTLSRDIERTITEAGGKYIRSRVGHSFVEHAMRDSDSVLAAESSGHYYFKEMMYKDSGIAGMIAFLCATLEEDVIKVLQDEKQFAIVTTLIPRPKEQIFLTEELAHQYDDARIDWLDGLSVRFDDWGFVLRESQTEMIWRLVVEAKRGEESARSEEVLANINTILTRARK